MLSSLAAALVLALGPQGGSTVIQVDAGRGPVDVRLPAGYTAGEAAPLLVTLHGYSATPWALPIFLPFEGWLDTYGFVRVAPFGTQDSTGRYFWNASSACCDFENQVPDDSGYLRALVELIRTQVDVDGRRIYVVGYSNGGFMAHRLGCDHADLFAAVVSVGGAGASDPLACAPSGPVSVLQLHGTADTYVTYLPGLFFGRPQPGGPQTVLDWATRLGCATVTSAGPDLDLDNSQPGAETTTLAYTGCPLGAAAELWTMNGVDHDHVPSNEFGPLILDWLLAHAKRGVDFTLYCTPAPVNNSGRVATLTATGTDALAANDFSLVADLVPTSTFGLFIGSLGQLQVQLPSGVNGPLCVGPQFARLGTAPLATGPLGRMELLVDLTSLPPVAPQGVVSGETWYFQAWHRDGAGLGLTDALEVTFR